MRTPKRVHDFLIDSGTHPGQSVVITCESARAIAEDLAILETIDVMTLQAAERRLGKNDDAGACFDGGFGSLTSPAASPKLGGDGVDPFLLAADKHASGAVPLIELAQLEANDESLSKIDVELEQHVARSAELREARARLNAIQRRDKGVCGAAGCTASRTCEVCSVTGCPHIVQKKKGRLLCPVDARTAGDKEA